MSSAATAKPLVLSSNCGDKSTERVKPKAGTGDGAQLAKQLFKLGRAQSVREFAYVVANSLCNQFACEQVALGVVKHGRVQVVSLSGCAQFKSGSPGVVEICQAMEEAVDQEKMVGFPITGEPAFPIHRKWSTNAGACFVCSLPLFCDKDIVGVVSFRRSDQSSFRSDDVRQLEETLSPYGDLLSLVDRANCSLWQRIVDAARLCFSKWRSPLRVAMSIVLLILFGWSVLGHMTYRPLCDAVVVASDLRHMTAPFEARLDRIYVRAGDRVQEGDVLVEFDTRKFELELETVRAESARTDVNIRAAIESGDASAAALHQAHINVLLAREAALLQRVEHARIIAPEDGMVIHSDFDNRLGQVYSQGAPVLQFATHAGWKLLIQVPEGVATYVRPNDVGVFASTARPNRKISFAIEQINGSAEVIDEENVFVGEAELQAAPEWMRSGMKGTARIRTRKMPPCWIMFHRAFDWMRLRFWI